MFQFERLDANPALRDAFKALEKEVNLVNLGKHRALAHRHMHELFGRLECGMAENPVPMAAPAPKKKPNKNSNAPKKTQIDMDSWAEVPAVDEDGKAIPPVVEPPKEPKTKATKKKATKKKATKAK